MNASDSRPDAAASIAEVPIDVSETPANVGSDWCRAPPLALLYFFGKRLTNLLASWSLIAALFAAALVFFQIGPLMVVIGAFGWLLMYAVSSFVEYWHFRFRIDGDCLRLRQGVLKRTELNVQFARVQGIAVEQSLVFRLLGLVTVGLDTAGTSREEARFPAVTPAFAEALRARVDRGGGSVASASDVADPVPPAASAEPAEQDPRDAATASDERLLVRLDSAEVARVGLVDWSALAGLVAFAMLWRVINFEDRLDRLPEWLERVVERLIAEVARLDLLVAVLAVAALLFAGVVVLLGITVVAAFLRFHDFTLAVRRNGDAFHTRRGLFTRKETVVERGKLQQIVLLQGPLLRLLGRLRLRIPAAGGLSVDADSPVAPESSVRVPLARPNDIGPIVESVFAEEGADLDMSFRPGVFRRLSPVYIRARAIAFGVVPALAVAGLLYPFFGAAALWCLAWAPLATLGAWQLWRRRGYVYNDHVLAYRSGVLGSRVCAVLFRKVQSVSIGQSPLQRRAGLASLDVGIATGGFTLAYVDQATVRRLRDYMLYKVESSTRPWY